MKNVKWMDVVIATPMALTFASKFGAEGMLTITFVLAAAAGLLKWGAIIRSRRVTFQKSPAKILAPVYNTKNSMADLIQ